MLIGLDELELGEKINNIKPETKKSAQIHKREYMKINETIKSIATTTMVSRLTNPD